MKPHHVNELNNFIAGWYLENEVLTNALWDISKSDKNSFDGVTSLGVNPDVKKSKDHALSTYPDVYREYSREIEKVLNLYIEKYPTISSLKLGILENINTQYYQATEGFLKFHFERLNSNEFTIYKREFAFITYLNNVHEGGETEFFYQELKIKPEKNLTIIFPASWNFTHRGNPSNYEKAISTGWIHIL